MESDASFVPWKSIVALVYDKLPQHTNLKMEVKKNDHFSLTWLEECILNIVVEDVYFVPSDACVPV